MFLEQLINGLAIGMIYALIAVGYSMVFGVLRLINFSHGAVFTFGAYAIYVCSVNFKLNIFVSILLGLLITGVLGMLIDKIGLEPLRKKNASNICLLYTSRCV